MGQSSKSLFFSYATQDDPDFVKRLYHDLRQENFNVWQDVYSMPANGMPFTTEIRKAIDQCERLLLVLGPKALASSYVSDEWQYAHNTGKPIIPIIRVGDKTLHFQELLPDKLRLLSSHDFRDDNQYDAQFKLLLNQLLIPTCPLAKFLNKIPELPFGLCTRTQDIECIKSLLLASINQSVDTTSTPRYIGIHGMGGIGKSVLANQLIRDSEIRRNFPDGIIWVVVNDNSINRSMLGIDSIVTLQREIAATFDDPGNFQNPAQGRNHLSNLIGDRSILFVLDDVWQANVVKNLLILNSNSRILLTSRDATLLTSLKAAIYPLKLFNEQQSQQLLADITAIKLEKLPDAAHWVAERCDGLPLALALSAGLVADIGWQGILDRFKALALKYIRTDYPEYPQHENLEIMFQISMDTLTVVEQECFDQLSVFPVSNIPDTAIYTLWSHTSNLEFFAQEDLLIRLMRRSLIQLDSDKPETDQNIRYWVSIHPLLRDFATKKISDLAQLHKKLLSAYQTKCHDGWASGPNDGYFFQYLCRHFQHAGLLNELQKLLLDFAFPLQKCSYGLINELFSDYKFANALSLNQKASILCWLDFLEKNLYLLRRGNQRWPPHKILLQLAMEHADDSVVTLAAEIWLKQNKCDWYWLRRINRPETTYFSPCRLVLEGHNHNIEEAIELKDGRIISWADDHTCRIWDTATGENVLTFEGFGTTSGGYYGGYYVYPRPGIIELPDHRALIWATHKELRLVDLHTGRIEKIFMHDNVVRGALLLNHRQILSWSEDRTARIWDVNSTEELHRLPHTGWVFGAKLLTDGRLLTWSGEYALHLWNPETGEKLAEMQGHEADIAAVIELSNGYMLSWTQRGHRKMRIWTNTGEAIEPSEIDDIESRLYQISHQVKIIQGNYIYYRMPDGTFTRQFQMTLGKSLYYEIQRDGIHYWNEQQPFSLPAPDIKGALKLSTGRVLMWDSLKMYILSLEAGYVNHQPTGFLHSFPAPKCLQSHFGGCEVAGVFELSNQQGICLWGGKIIHLLNYLTGEEMVLTGHQEDINGVLQLSDRNGFRLASWSDDGTIRIWDASTGQPLHVLTGHNGKIKGLRELSDGRLLTRAWLFAASRQFGSYTQDDTTLRIWQIPESNVPLAPDKPDIKRFAYLSGKQIFAASARHSEFLSEEKINDSIWLIDATNGTILKTISKPMGKFWGIFRIDDERIATIGEDDHQLRIWNGLIAEELKTFDLASGVQGIRRLENGWLVVISKNRILRVINEKNHEVMQFSLSGEMNDWADLKNQYLAVYFNDSPIVAIINLNKAALTEYTLHHVAIKGILGFMDGNLATWDKSGVLKIWRVSTGETIACLEDAKMREQESQYWDDHSSGNYIMELDSRYLIWVTPVELLARNSVVILDYIRNNIATYEQEYFTASSLVALSENSFAILPYSDGNVVIYSLSGLDPVSLKSDLLKKTKGIFSLNNQRVLTWNHAGRLGIWSSLTGDSLEQIDLSSPSGNLDTSTSVSRAFDDYQYFIFDHDKRIALLNLKSDAPDIAIWHSPYEISASRIHKNGTMIVLSHDLCILKLYYGNTPCDISIKNTKPKNEKHLLDWLKSIRKIWKSGRA